MELEIKQRDLQAISEQILNLEDSKHCNYESGGQHSDDRRRRLYSFLGDFQARYQVREQVRTLTVPRLAGGEFGVTFLPTGEVLRATE